jgi:hypothetical protein
VAVVLTAALLCACASAPAPAAVAATPSAGAAPARRSLDETEALSLIDELLLEAKQRPVPGWHVALPTRGELDVDVRIGESDFGIEWVSALDRSRYGDALPAPAPAGQLRLLSAAEGGPGRTALILVLDHETYQLAASGTPTARAFAPPGEARELERRLRRDLTDFLDYARSQYRL